MYKLYEEIKEGILNRISGIDKREGSFVNDMVSPVSLEMEAQYQELSRLLDIMFLQTNSGEYLDRRAAEYGLIRKDGTKATGTVTITGNADVVIPAGTLVATKSGLSFETTQEAVIPTDTVDIPIQAASIGAKYNVAENQITELPVGVIGVSGVTNQTAASGGTDGETDGELRKRLELRLQNPPTSGNESHYKMWALEVDGIGDARVFPEDGGPGTVKVIPVTSEKRAPNSGTITAVLNHINENKPIGAVVAVVAPQETAINVSAAITLNSGYTLSDIKADYTEALEKYLMDSVLKLYTVDYYKCLSLFYELPGVSKVTSFKLNNTTSNVAISDANIQVIGTVTITEG